MDSDHILLSTDRSIYCVTYILQTSLIVHTLYVFMIDTNVYIVNKILS